MSQRRWSSAAKEIYKDFHCWRQFIAGTRNRGVVTEAVDLTIRGQGHKMITKNLTAFDIGDAEARAWLGYFRGIGAIASQQTQVNDEGV